MKNGWNETKQSIMCMDSALFRLSRPLEQWLRKETARKERFLLRIPQKCALTPVFHRQVQRDLPEATNFDGPIHCSITEK